MSKPDGRGQGGQLTAVRELTGDVAPIRAALADEDPLMRALGRPNREQVVTRRESIATTLQALELTNGPTLDRILATGAKNWLNRPAEDSEQLVDAIYRTALGRSPVPAELSAARQLLGDTPSEASVQDLLWAVVMLPEFQLIQ